ncbi:MAG: hypothetical protein Tsb0020_45220 [Haliangiales bacterium]
MIIALTGLPAQRAAAQAWVGDGDNLSVSLDYSYAPSDTVYESWENRDIIRTGEDPIVNHSLVFGAEYNPIKRLALQVGVPLIATRYDAPEGSTFPRHGRYDDGDYHLVLQDLRVDARYMVLGNEIVAIAPHIALSVPLTDYETQGFANGGRGLKQLIFGLSVGKYFTSGVPDLYLHGRYEFRWTEGYETAFPETAEYGQNKSGMQFLIGYFVLNRLEINLAADLQLAHGGFVFEDYVENEPDPGTYFHDALLAEQFFLFGGGASYQVTDRLRLSAFARVWLWGEQTRNASAYGLGASWDVM